MMKSALLFFLLLTSVRSIAGTEISSSGAKRIPLVELFSSESCSSCPPADEWISSLKNRPGLFKDFVPVVFHVTYWNHLNWKDGFSSEAMTTRQKDLARTWAEPSVYTPAVVVNGEEFKWRKADFPKPSPAAPVELSLAKEGDLEFTATAKFLTGGKKYLVRVALLGMGIESKVTSGENGGHNFNHNFLVLDWKSQDLPSMKKIRVKFDKPAQKTSKLAVAAWIEEQGNPTPLQSTGGYL